jgi:hypothetical protein
MDSDEVPAEAVANPVATDDASLPAASADLDLEQALKGLQVGAASIGS